MFYYVFDGLSDFSFVFGAVEMKRGLDGCLAAWAFAGYGRCGARFGDVFFLLGACV